MQQILANRPHPCPLPRGEGARKFKVPLPWGEGFRVRVDL
jgi:hypothetical protein